MCLHGRNNAQVIANFHLSFLVGAKNENDNQRWNKNEDSRSIVIIAITAGCISIAVVVAIFAVFFIKNSRTCHSTKTNAV